MLALPFVHLNLRYNPFGELDAGARARIAVVEPLAVARGEILQLLGEAGRGKTTHLLALAHVLPGSVYEYVPEGECRFRARSFPPQGYLLDEAQRVRPRLLRWLFARAPRLFIASHADLSGLSSRPVRTVRVGGLGQAKLDAILRARIEAARRGPGPVPRVGAEAQQRLLDRFGDDLRAMQSHLYDLFQRLEGPIDVQV